MSKDEKIKVAVYCRCSTTHQDISLQRDDLLKYCEQRGWTVYKVYEDNGVSGAVSSRPSLDEMMRNAKQGKFDCVLVWRFDRFGRSLSHLVSSLDLFKELGILQSLDTHKIDNVFLWCRLSIEVIEVFGRHSWIGLEGLL